MPWLRYVEVTEQTPTAVHLVTSLGTQVGTASLKPEEAHKHMAVRSSPAFKTQ